MRAGNTLNSGGKKVFFVGVIVRIILEERAAIGLGRKA